MKKKKELVRFNADDQRLFFSLGMIFFNTLEVRKSISRYPISRGVHLKFVENDCINIRGKCEDGGPISFVGVKRQF